MAVSLRNGADERSESEELQGYSHVNESPQLTQQDGRSVRAPGDRQGAVEIATRRGGASRGDPESCVVWGNPGGEALTGGGAGKVLSREILHLSGADAVDGCGRHHRRSRQGQGLKGQARSETLGMFLELLAREPGGPTVGQGNNGALVRMVNSKEVPP